GGLVLGRYPSLQTAGRCAMYGGVLISSAISILALLPRLRPAQKSRLLTYWFPVDRGVSFGLAIFLLVMMFLVSRFPIKLSRNVILHTSLFTILFLNHALNNLFHTFFGTKMPPIVDLGNRAISAVCG